MEESNYNGNYQNQWNHRHWYLLKPVELSCRGSYYNDWRNRIAMAAIEACGIIFQWHFMKPVKSLSTGLKTLPIAIDFIEFLIKNADKNEWDMIIPFL